MQAADFSFELPEEQIAQYPPAERGQSRLMVLDRVQKSLAHHMMPDLPSLVEPGSLLVFNNSKVRKARIYGTAEASGAKAEFLLLQRLDAQTWTALAQRSKRRRPGSRYTFADSVEAEITGGDGQVRVLRFNRPMDDSWLDQYGHIPLPPYIRRDDEPMDSDRYQTVYAAITGSAAAPTAGLHFTREILDQLADRGVETAYLTLHVGLGTFLPVRTGNLEDHRMHEETYTIDEETASRVEKAKAEGRRVVAVGTTSVRALESAWEGGGLRRGEASTSIFIYPGYTFKVVDRLFTNFHTPESTLLMLVAGFVETKPPGVISAKPGELRGREFILEAYREAVQRGYRFFSYGDAMLIN
jgi:S-adenosylmethionine:tRNA ribosyltransferase-isomerase